MATVSGAHLKCNRCGHEWKQHKKDPPTRCANTRCGTKYWNAVYPLNLSTQQEDTVPKPADPSCPNCPANFQLAQEAEVRATQLKAENDRLTSELAMAPTERDFATLPELIAHCENGECASHAEGWNQVKEKIVAEAYEKMTPELVLAKAQEKGFVPSRLVIRS